jgi:hypothetical protein
VSEPSRALAVSSGSQQDQAEAPYRVTTGPLEVTRGSGPEAEGEVPDWVMVGLPNADGGVRLFASQTLTRAGLQRRVDGFTRVPVTANPNGPVARIPNEALVVVAVMKDFTLINAASYPDALRSLTELWDRART